MNSSLRTGLLIVLSLTIGGCELFAPKDKTGALVVTSDPPGATIMLAGVPVGQTPATLEHQVAGKTHIRLQLEGHFPYEVDAQVERGQSRTVTGVLQPAPKCTIAFQVNRNLYIVRPDGIAPSLIATDCSGARLAWSSGGRFLAYLSAGGITIISRDLTQKHHLDFNPYTVDDFVWSHRGSLLAFGSYIDGLYLYDANTNNLTRLIATSATYDHNPTFSPDDNEVAFLHNEYGTNVWIEVIGVDGSHPRIVKEKFEGEFDANLGLNWLDSGQLLFWGPAPENAGRYGPILLNIHDRAESAVPDTLCGTIPIISPDGHYYAFTRFHFDWDPHGVFVGTVSNWQSHRIEAKIPDVFFHPFIELNRMVWSADGKAIVGSDFSNIWWLTTDAHLYRVIPNLEMNSGNVSIATTE